MTENKDEKGEEAADHTEPEKPPFWEWVVAVLGLALVISAVAFLLYEALIGEKTPPAIDVRADSIRRAGKEYVVQIRARNNGKSTAAEVVVEGELKRGDTAVETSEVTFDFIPSRSERRGGLFFTEDPRQYQLDLRAIGYREP